MPCFEAKTARLLMLLLLLAPPARKAFAEVDDGEQASVGGEQDDGESESPKDIKAEKTRSKTGDKPENKADKPMSGGPDEEKLTGSGEAVLNPPTLSPSALSLRLAKRLSLITSFGRSSVTVKGKSWFSSGVSDIKLSYLLSSLESRNPIAFSARYSAFDVASFSTETKEAGYIGAVELWAAGILYKRTIKNQLRVGARGELGLTKLTTRYVYRLPDTKVPQRLGGLVEVAGLLDYGISPNFALGPELRAGFGSFTSFHLLMNASFAF